MLIDLTAVQRFGATFYTINMHYLNRGELLEIQMKFQINLTTKSN